MFFHRIVVVTLLMLAPGHAYSQLFDESFLSSLPESLAADFIDQAAAPTQDDEKYSNPNTRIKNLEAELRQAEKSLENIRQRVGTELNQDDGVLRRFGSEFFDTYQSSFLPINEPNMNTNYILDVGDQLTIQLVGQSRRTKDTRKINILRDGSINIPDVGKVFVAGLDLTSATNLIQTMVSVSLVGVQTFVSLSELRDVNVLIVGNAVNPGMYTLSGGSNPLALINAAGGITDSGSFRFIEHKRDSQLLKTIDLYDVLVDGDLSSLIQLRSGDSVVVRQVSRQARISGGISKPGIYEINENESLEDLLNFSGYISNNNSSSTLSIERRDQTKYKNLEVSLDQASNVQLQDGDSVEVTFVKPIFNKAKTVNISGEVQIPGSYTVADGTTLSELIALAGEYTDRAYPLGGVFQRDSVKKVEGSIKEKGYNELIRFLVSSQGGIGGLSASLSSDSLITFLTLLREYEPSGRLITEFEVSKLRSKPTLDRVLEDGDSIHIPAFMNEVFVYGEVMNPSGYNFDSSLDVKDYLKLSGGYSRSADDTRVILIHPNGNAELIKTGLFNSLSNNSQVLPGSLIYVPRYIGKVDGISLASAVAPIVSSFALSIASLNSINN